MPLLQTEYLILAFGILAHQGFVMFNLFIDKLMQKGNTSAGEKVLVDAQIIRNFISCFTNFCVK